MTAKKFSWNLPRIETIISHLADLNRWDNPFTGQNQAKVLDECVEYLNTQQSFTGDGMVSKERHLKGGEGILKKIYGHAEALFSQKDQLGRDAAFKQLSYSSMGILGGRYDDVDLNSRIFEGLMLIGKSQLEDNLGKLERMTSIEKRIQEKKEEAKEKDERKFVQIEKKVRKNDEKAEKAEISIKKEKLGKAVIIASTNGKNKRNRWLCSDFLTFFFFLPFIITHFVFIFFIKDCYFRGRRRY